MPFSRIRTTNNNIEHLYVHIKYKSHNIILSNVSFPPNSNFTNYEKYSEELEDISEIYSDTNMICCGKFNIPGRFFKVFHHSTIVSMTNNQTVITNIFAMLNMFQEDFIENENNGLLDLRFSSYEIIHIQFALDVLLPLDYHHPALYFSMSSKEEPTYIFFDFKNANYDLIVYYLSDIDLFVLMVTI